MYRPTRSLPVIALAWMLAACGGEPVPEPAPGSFTTDTAQLYLDGRSESIPITRVSAEFFTSTRLMPLLGRGFADEEYLPTASPVAILHHDFWEQRLASAPSAIGSTLDLNGQATTVVGVMPAGLEFPGGGQLLVPRTNDR